MACDIWEEWFCVSDRAFDALVARDENRPLLVLVNLPAALERHCIANPEGKA